MEAAGFSAVLVSFCQIRGVTYQKTVLTVTANR